MNSKELGNTGVQVPEIGLGTWQYRGGVEPLRRGIELGATFIDTAEIYGTEDAVGEAVAPIRDEVFIALGLLLEAGTPFDYAAVRELAAPAPPQVPELALPRVVDLRVYDRLLAAGVR